EDALTQHIAVKLRVLADIVLMVGESLGCEDQEERRGGMETRNRDVPHLGTEPAQRGQCLLEGLRHLWIYIIKEIGARHTDFHAADIPTKRGEIVIDRGVTRSGIGGVVPGHGLEEIGTVLDRARHWAGVIERPRERQDPGTTRASVGRLEPDDAAERRRPTDRAAGVGTRRADHQTSRQSGARATARAARNMVEIPGVASWLKAMARQLQPKRKLVRDKFAQEHCPRLLPALYARGVGLGEPVSEQRRPTRGADTPRAVDVFVRHRDPQERAWVVPA